MPIENFQDDCAPFLCDDAFLNIYCTDETISRLKYIQISTVRSVLGRLTSEFNQVAHSTPGLWTPKDEPQPIVVMGRISADGKILEPKLGLCSKDRLLYFFASEFSIIQFFNEIKSGGNLSIQEYWEYWEYWRSRGNNNPPEKYYRTKAHIDCCGFEVLPYDHPLTENRLENQFIKWTAAELARKGLTNHNGQKTIKKFANGHLPKCIYPKFVQEFRSWL